MEKQFFFLRETEMYQFIYSSKLSVHRMCLVPGNDKALIDQIPQHPVLTSLGRLDGVALDVIHYGCSYFILEMEFFLVKQMGI